MKKNGEGVNFVARRSLSFSIKAEDISHSDPIVQAVRFKNREGSRCIYLTSALQAFLGEVIKSAPQDVVNYLRAGGKIKKQLERNFRADDVTGYVDRRRKLRQAFVVSAKIVCESPHRSTAE